MFQYAVSLPINGALINASLNLLVSPTQESIIDGLWTPGSFSYRGAASLTKCKRCLSTIN